MMKDLLEAFMQEERAMDLEAHPTQANGYPTRDLLPLVGPIEDLRVPCVWKGDFHPKILPYRQWTTLELSKAILALYAAGGSTRAISAISRFLEGIYGAFYSPQSISRLTQVVEEAVRA